MDVKILIIEDDTEIVEFIALAFKIAWPEARLLSADHGHYGLELVEKESPDLVLLDLGLPDTNGFEVLKMIRLFSTVPIIIMTVKGDESDIVKGLEWGANEYMVKPFGQLELLARVRAVFRDSHQSVSYIASYGPLQYDPSSNILKYGQIQILLTRTEGRIIHLLIKNPGYVVTFSEIAEAIWGEDYSNSTDTLRVHIRRLRAKTEVNYKIPRFIHSRAGIGFYLELPAQVLSHKNDS